MLKKTITFEDLDGNPVTEDFYFNLTIPEITKMQFSTPEGLGERVEQMIKNGNGGEIMAFFDMLLTESVGRKGADNRKFEKSPEIAADFMQTDAYTKLFTELCTNTQAGIEFFNSLMPSEEKIKEFLANAQKAQNAQGEKPLNPEKPAWELEDREPTQEELMSMPREELLAAMKRRTQKANQATES